MAFFNSAVTVLQTLVVALGVGLGIWGAINLLEGYGNDDPGAKSKGMKQLMAGGGMAPIPFSTFGNREQSMVGQNYLRSLFALGVQGFLIMICVGIYAVLIQSISVSDDIIGSIWGILGYKVLLCFTLFKTGALAKRVFSAH